VVGCGIDGRLIATSFTLTHSLIMVAEMTSGLAFGCLVFGGVEDVGDVVDGGYWLMAA